MAGFPAAAGSTCTRCRSPSGISVLLTIAVPGGGGFRRSASRCQDGFPRRVMVVPGQFWPVVSLATGVHAAHGPQGVRVLPECPSGCGRAFSCGAAGAPSLLITGAGTVAALTLCPGNALAQFSGAGLLGQNDVLLLPGHRRHRRSGPRGCCRRTSAAGC